MAKYDFKCPNCEEIYTDLLMGVNEEHEYECPNCGDWCIKYFGNISVRISGGLPAHFNPALGQEVTGWRDMEEKAKKLSDEQSKEQGMEVRYKPVDLRDKERFGVTDQGLKETYNASKDNDALRKTIKSV